jgi:hypothetical protein
MKNKDTIQNEVRKTMDFLDKMPKLEGNPFLFTRVQARLAEAGEGRSPQEGSRVWAIIRPALIALLIVLNVVTIINSLQSSTSRTVDRKEALSMMIDDYSLSGSYTSPTE